MATVYLNCNSGQYIGTDVFVHCSVTPYSVNKNYVFTVEYEAEDRYGVKQTGTIKSKVGGNFNSYGFDWRIPDVFYEYIPNNTTLNVTLKCSAYEYTGASAMNATLIGSTTKDITVICKESICTPVIEGTVTLAGDNTAELTGNTQKFIKNYSKVTAQCNVTTKYSSTLKDYSIYHNRTEYINGELFVVKDKDFKFSAQDSRGYVAQITKTYDVVDYFRPTINIEVSSVSIDGKINISISGKYFKGSFGAQENTLTVYYSYKENKDGGWKPSQNVSVIVNENGEFTYEATLTGFEATKTYRFYATVKDKINTNGSNVAISKGKPIWDWSGSNFNFNIPVSFNAGLNTSVNANTGDYVVYQGVKNNWNIRQWNSGIAECWKTETDSCSMATNNSTQHGGIILESDLFGGGSYPSLYKGYGNFGSDWGHFVEAPNLFINVALSQIANIGTTVPVLTTQITSYGSSTDMPHWKYLFLTTERTLNVKVTVSLYAIGRWKS